MPKLKKIGVLLTTYDDADKLVELLQDGGYLICQDDESEDGVVYSILEENIN